MKRLTAISVASLLLAAFAATGCNPISSGGSYTDYFLVKTEETTNGIRTVTDYERSATDGSVVKETRKVGGVPVHLIDDYTLSGNVHTRYRSDYAEDGITVAARYKLVTTYGVTYGNQMLETKYEEYLLTGEDADESNPAVLVETGWNSDGQQISHIRKENGSTVLSRLNYTYLSDGSNYTYVENRYDGNTPVLMFMKSTRVLNQYYVVEYERYANWDGSDGTLVEKRTDFNTSDNTQSYKQTLYDSEGNNPVETSVTNTYTEMTITY